MQHQVLTAIHPPYLWREAVTDPYLLLREFFDYTTIELQHQYTDKFINAACSTEYVKEKPGQLLSWYEKTLCLFYAAKLVHEDSMVAEIQPPDISTLEWKEQPHWLHAEEIQKPWMVVDTCFRFMPYEQWQIELHTWLHAAFYEHTVLEEVSKSHETIRLLHKLADAIWVIYRGSQLTGEKSLGELAKRKKDAEENDGGPTGEERLHILIKGFFTAQGAGQAKEELWETTKMALTNGKEEPDADQRSDMLFLYEQLCRLIDAMMAVFNELHEIEQ